MSTARYAGKDRDGLVVGGDECVCIGGGGGGGGGVAVGLRDGDVKLSPHYSSLFFLLHK